MTNLTARQPHRVRKKFRSGSQALVDILTLALTHGLMAVALWRLLWREDLGQDPDDASVSRRPWLPAPTGDGDGTN